MENIGFVFEPIEKRKENKRVAQEPIENTKKTRCCVGTHGKRKENTGVALEPIENNSEPLVLRRNLLKTQEKRRCCVGTYETKRKGNMGVA